MKKLGVLFATIIMVMLFAVSASAATEGYYTYKIANGVADITDVDTSISGDVVIPSTFEGYNVKYISWRAFEDCINLRSVTIPDGVTGIGEGAFQGCTGLTSITIPDSVTHIGYIAFQSCTGLASITIPDTVSSIAAGAFNNTAYCKDISNWENGALYIGNHLIKIDSSVISCNIRPNTRTIAGDAFIGCNKLVDITIPDSVSSLSNEAFHFCGSIKNITVDENNKFYCSVDGILFNKDKTTLVRYPAGNTRMSYVIPDGVTTIDYFAFCGCASFTNITIPDSVTNIEFGAFENCDNLTSITLPNSLKTIGNAAFRGCECLTNITIPQSVSYIVGAEAFGDCTSLSYIRVDENNEYYCSVDGVLFNKDMTCIVKYPEANTNSSYEISDSVTEITPYAFSGCKSLADIYYVGTEEQWNKIWYTSDINATIHFNSCIINLDKKHSYNPIVTSPTCTTDGYTAYTCACGYTYAVDYVDMLGHNMSDYYIVTNATCIAKGSEKSDCSRCGYSETRDLDIIPHNYSAVVTAPTCIAQGYTTYTCVCGDTYVADYVDMLGHDMSDYYIVTNATCTAKGSEKSDCSRCDYFETKEIKALGHNMGDFVLVKESTCTEKGEERAECSRCNYYKTKEIKALGHNLGAYVVTKESTCTEKGEEKAECTRCDYIKTKSIALKKHIDANGDENCDVCELYLPSLDCLCVCHAKSIGALVYKLFTLLDKIFDIGLLEKVFHITSDYCACGLKH